MFGGKNKTNNKQAAGAKSAKTSNRRRSTFSQNDKPKKSRPLKQNKQLNSRQNSTNKNETVPLYRTTQSENDNLFLSDEVLLTPENIMTMKELPLAKKEGASSISVQEFILKTQPLGTNSTSTTLISSTDPKEPRPLDILDLLAKKENLRNGSVIERQEIEKIDPSIISSSLTKSLIEGNQQQTPPLPSSSYSGIYQTNQSANSLLYLLNRGSEFATQQDPNTTVASVAASLPLSMDVTSTEKQNNNNLNKSPSGSPPNHSRWAGPAYHNSPAPNKLPLPNFELSPKDSSKETSKNGNSQSVSFAGTQSIPDSPVIPRSAGKSGSNLDEISSHLKMMLNICPVQS